VAIVQFNNCRDAVAFMAILTRFKNRYIWLAKNIYSAKDNE